MVTQELVRLVGSAPRGCFAGGASAPAVSSPAPLWDGRWSSHAHYGAGAGSSSHAAYEAGAGSSPRAPYGSGAGSSSQALYGAETGPSANPPTYSERITMRPSPKRIVARTMILAMGPVLGVGDLVTLG